MPGARGEYRAEGRCAVNNAIAWEIEYDNDTGSDDEQRYNVGPVQIPFSGGAEEKEAALNIARLVAQTPVMADILMRAYSHVTHGGPKRAEVEDVLRKAGVL